MIFICGPYPTVAYGKELLNGRNRYPHPRPDLIWIESNQKIYSRNPFPPGGVYENPATGAAAAALAGYLRDIKWQGDKSVEILQGQDMGIPSRLFVQYTGNKGESIKVSGETRNILGTGD